MVMHAAPRSWMSWSYELRDDEGVVAQVERGWFRERAEIAIRGERFVLERESWMSGAFLPARKGALVASAEKESWFCRSFLVTAGDRRLELSAKSMFSRDFLLREGFRQIGSVRPVGVFTRCAEVDLPEDLDLYVRVFVFALVTLLWKRASDAAGS
jgi:hypothetical protein